MGALTGVLCTDEEQSKTCCDAVSVVQTGRAKNGTFHPGIAAVRGDDIDEASCSRRYSVAKWENGRGSGEVW